MVNAKALATRKEVAAHLKISINTVSKLMAAGEIKHMKIGSQFRFDIDDLLQCKSVKSLNKE